MAEALYMDDSYLKEFDATVKLVSNGKFIVLDKTAFFPKGGGVEWDTGIMTRKSDSKEFKVIYAGKFKGEISHEVSEEGHGSRLGLTPYEIEGVLKLLEYVIRVEYRRR